MHVEYLEVSAAACAAINAARAAGGRVIAVGTTVVRSLETAAAAAGGTDRAPSSRPTGDPTRMFIRPAIGFAPSMRCVTNFHLPESTLLMLCAAFVGTPQRSSGLRSRGGGALPLFQLRRCDVRDAGAGRLAP